MEKRETDIGEESKYIRMERREEREGERRKTNMVIKEVLWKEEETGKEVKEFIRRI